MRRAWLVLMASLALIPLAYATWQLMEAARVGALVPIDFDLYRGATSRWLAGGSFYESWQLAGPYDVRQGAVLYPPVALWLFVPFTVLPPVLWWVVPLAGTAWALSRLRPVPLAWPLLAACLAWPPTIALLAHGNPGMWVMAAVALAALYRWPAVLVFMKPSLAPLAFIGARDHRWWLALAAFAILSAVFGAMWADWIRVIVNARGAGILYSWMEVPMVLIGVIAWVGRAADADRGRHAPVLSSRS
jgi:hypothetical protein